MICHECNYSSYILHSHFDKTKADVAVKMKKESKINICIYILYFLSFFLLVNINYEKHVKFFMINIFNKIYFVLFQKKIMINMFLTFYCRGSTIL